MDTKRLVNVASLPTDIEIESGWDACVASMARPATQQRIKTLIERGFSKPGDAENRLGRFRGTVWALRICDGAAADATVKNQNVDDQSEAWSEINEYGFQRQNPKRGFLSSCHCEQRLRQLGIKLPVPPEPFGIYAEAVQTGNLLFSPVCCPLRPQSEIHRAHRRRAGCRSVPQGGSTGTPSGRLATPYTSRLGFCLFRKRLAATLKRRQPPLLLADISEVVTATPSRTIRVTLSSDPRCCLATSEGV